MTLFPENVALALYEVLVAGIVGLLAAQAARGGIARRIRASWRDLRLELRVALLAGLIGGAAIHRCEAGLDGNEYCGLCHSHTPADWHGTGLSISPDRALLGVNTGESVGLSVSGDSYEQLPAWSIAPMEEGGATLVASGGSATVEAGSRTGVYTVTATAGSCSDSAEVIVYGVDYLTIEPDMDGYAEEIVHFSGMTPHPFDRTHSPVPDLHQPVFFKDVQTDLVAQPFEVDLVAHLVPDCVTEADVNCEWSLVGDGVDGILTSEQSAMARFEPTSGGGVYRFVFECGSVSNSEAVLVLPLSGASVDEIMVDALQRTDNFCNEAKRKYPLRIRNSRRFGKQWFYDNGSGDFLGLPEPSILEKKTDRSYNSINLPSGLNGVATWHGVAVRNAKLSNFLVGYACKKVGVVALARWYARTNFGSHDDTSAEQSWNAGVAVANEADYHTTSASMVSNIWDKADMKNRLLWPNITPASNWSRYYLNPTIDFSEPSFTGQLP